jgi:hypothetical protein
MPSIELTPEHGYVLMVAGIVSLQARRRSCGGCRSRAACLPWQRR